MLILLYLLECSDEGNNDVYNLQNINLEVEKGSLVAVVGMVGSGKSSLLSATLGKRYEIITFSI